LIAPDLSVAKLDRAHRVPRDVGLVRHNDHRQPFLFIQPLQDVHDFNRSAAVEIPGRLIGKHDLRVVDQSPRDGHALLLSARKLARMMLRAVSQSHALERFPGALMPFRRGDARVDRGQFDVFQRRRPREQIKLLKHEPQLPVADARQLVLAHVRDVGVVQPVMPFRRPVQAAKDVH